MRIQQIGLGRIRLTWEGAEVAVLYRACLAELGTHDDATGDVYRATANRQDFTEDLDPTDAETVARVLFNDGQERAARRVLSARWTAVWFVATAGYYFGCMPKARS